MKRSLIMTLLVIATIALYAGNSGNIIYLKGESLIFPKFYWLIFIPLAIILAYIWKVGRQNGNVKDKI